ncbi:hypothetical protein [Legionella pneumophila]|uniref:hypothetical protein n=1 Tax=Legionella pneumophila TaxID=446 RepID=UPI000D056092|nr:hypothetical protein [Legionella pneumophila]
MLVNWLRITEKVLIFLIICGVLFAESTKPVMVFNYPVEAIYLINNPKDGGISWGHDYEEACKKMGDKFFWGIVPSKNVNPACYTLPSYNMIIGADTWFCANGSISYFNKPHNFCDDFPTCPDQSWTFETDKLICTRENRPCIPDPDSVSEEQLLAAVAYGESHWSNDYEEMAGIASATLQRMKAYGYKSVSELISKDPNFAYATALKTKNERYYNLMCNINSNGVELAYKAARNALSNGEDYSNGGCFWDGVDVKTNGASAYRYKYGFKFSNPKHNVLDVTEPKPFHKKGRNGKYFSHTYVSTAGHNKTIFWKLSKEFLATGAKQCI